MNHINLVWFKLLFISRRASPFFDGRTGRKNISSLKKMDWSPWCWFDGVEIKAIRYPFDRKKKEVSEYTHTIYLLRLSDARRQFLCCPCITPHYNACLRIVCRFSFTSIRFQTKPRRSIWSQNDCCRTNAADTKWTCHANTIKTAECRRVESSATGYRHYARSAETDVSYSW